MKRRNKNYIERKKAFRSMINFTDLKSFLMAGFKTSRSMVVKKDIVNMLMELNQPNMAYAKAS
ncbi:MAG TPA: hypothetical protein VL093_06305 [Flavipsychrobacter sp.]|jgi:hypothetical protein|nr:hypothetical protein [Flavipsychrobacter sp.]